MKNLPIFTVRNPELSRWQSFVEKALKEKHPNLSLGEIRNLPELQGCWLHVKQAMEGSTPKAIDGDFDTNNIEHHAYASAFFFNAAKEASKAKNTTNLSTSIDTWPYSTAEWWQWLGQSIYSGYLSWDYLTGNWMYRDYEKEGNGNINYSVIDWKLPSDSKVALIGDWGTGNTDAHEFLRALLAKEEIDCIIHLGDIYYTGTEDECTNYFLNVIRQEIGSQVPVFTIPGNHEYYSFGHGFYGLIDTINNGIPISNTRQAASYFCLRTDNDEYQFLGLDTGYNDHSAWDTNFTPPAPALKSSNDYKWAIDKIKNFRGKTILLSHHQLFSRTGDMNSDQYGDSYANPHLYKHFSPFFHNKIATWFWGHEHSFALFKNGAFGLNQGRLVGSSSYEEATTDNPYANNYPMVPYSDANTFLATNPAYNNDHDANYYYPHVGAIITMRTNNNPKVDYYRYPSWENGHAPSNPQLTLITSEIIQNPTKSPTGGWSGNHQIKSSNAQSNKAPALATIGEDLYMVYKNTNDHKNLWWDQPSYDTLSGKIISNPSILPVDISTTGSDKTPTTDKHPAMVYFEGQLHLVYKDSDNSNLKWCVYNPDTQQWTKNGNPNSSMVSNNGPSLAVFNGVLYCFFLSTSDDATIKYATCNGSSWTYEGSFKKNGTAVVSHHTVCPAIVGNASNLFLVYAPSSSSYNLAVVRMDTSGTVYDVGNVTNNNTLNDFVPQTSTSISVCGDDKFLRLLYRAHDNDHKISWATLDLGYYDDYDQFIAYDLNTQTPTWSGGLPIVCLNNGDIPQTSDFPGYCMNDKYSFMAYPGNSSDQLWSAIQKNW